MIKVKQKHPAKGLGVICELFGKTRQALYSRQKSFERKRLDCELIVGLVLEKRKLMPLIGTRKLYYLLKKEFLSHGIEIGRDYLFEVLRDYDLLVKKRKRRVVTTHSQHWMKKYKNLIKDLPVVRPDQVWVSDITYVRELDGFRYLSLVTDLYSHRIMGYSCSKTLETEGSLQALKMALKERKEVDKPLIHHSDRGIQYCSHEYTGLLKQHRIVVSMGEVGNPYENAVAERVNGILKEEFLLSEKFNGQVEVDKQVAHSISVYNSLRPHLSCGYLTPDQAYVTKGPLEKQWKSYKKRQNLPHAA